MSEGFLMGFEPVETLYCCWVIDILSETQAAREWNTFKLMTVIIANLKHITVIAD